MAVSTMERMEQGRRVGVWERWAPLSGILFVVLGIVSLSMDNMPDRNASAAAYALFYAKSGNRTQVIISVYVMALATIAFLAFATTLWSRMRQLEGDVAPWSTVILASGVLFVATFMVLGTAVGAVAAAVSIGGEPAPSSEVARFVPQLGDVAFFVFGMFSASCMVAATSIAALRAGLLPRWLAWAGFVVAVVVLFGASFFPMFVFLLWVVAASIALVLRPTAELGARLAG